MNMLLTNSPLVDYFVTGNLKDFSVTNIHKLTDIKIVSLTELV